MMGANTGCCVKQQGAQDNINNGDWVDDSDTGGLYREQNENKSAESLMRDVVWIISKTMNTNKLLKFYLTLNNIHIK